MFNVSAFQSSQGALLAELALGDCVEVLASLPAESFDAVVTSPPYNLGIDYGPGFDDSIPRADYLAWTGRWLAAVKRSLTANGSLFLNIGGKPTDPWGPFEVALEARKHFELQNIIHWVKSISFDGEPARGHAKPVNSPRFLTDCAELVLHFTKTGKVPLDKLAIGVPFADESNLERGNRGANGNLRSAGNCFFVPYPTIQSRDDDRPHPATFPRKLAEMCLKIHGVARIKRVLDPFAGLGSTLVAAAGLGLPAFGVELLAHNHEEACRRLNTEVGPSAGTWGRDRDVKPANITPTDRDVKPSKIVHRDIKPENVLIDARAAAAVDFG